MTTEPEPAMPQDEDADRNEAEDQYGSRRPLAGATRRVAQAYVILLLVDTVGVTVLGMVEPSAVPLMLLMPVALAALGWLAFRWAPEIRPPQEDIEAMAAARRIPFKASLAVVAIAQGMVVLIALACLLLIVVDLAI